MTHISSPSSRFFPLHFFPTLLSLFLFSFLCHPTLLSLSVHAGTTVPTFQNPIGPVGSSQPLCANHWQNIGPFHVLNSYTGINSANDPEDIGAANEVYVAPNADVAFLAAVNGGVWKTSNVHSYTTFGGPHWQPVTDSMPCASMHTISGSADDPNVVVAGCGYPSNSASRGGEARGVLISLDNGATWRVTAFPAGWWVSSVQVSGSGETARVVVAAKDPVKPTSGQTGNTVDSYQIGTSNTMGGVWLSTNAGTTFSLILQNQSVRKIVRNPTTKTTLYAVVTPASSTDMPLYISTDEGATWTAASGVPSWSASCAQSTTVINAQLSVSSVNGNSVIFVAYYLDRNCYCFFQSTSNGASWTAIVNTPTGGSSLGSQGKANFAILSAPTSLTTLFVAGTGGLVFRVDTSSNTWTLISTPNIDPSTDTPSYKTTKSSSAPHADARQFTWDYKTGDLLLTNDGGVYRRTNPLLSPEQGDWSSLAGDLSITEIYQMALDPTTGALVLGAQDNSVMISQFDGNEKTSGIWSFLLTGDGTTVGIDSSSSPASFYGANQNLAGWFRVPVNGNTGGAGVNTVLTSFQGNFGAASCAPGTASCLSFLTPQAVNSVQPSRVLICTQASTKSVCYDSSFSTQTATALEFDSSSVANLNDVATVYVFGGTKNGVTNANVVLAVGKSFVWSRSNPVASTAAITTYTGNSCSGSCQQSNMLNLAPPWAVPITNNIILAQHPADYYINMLIDDSGHIWLTLDFGQSWVDLNLPATSNLLSVTGHTSVDTFCTGALYWFPVQINGVYPLIVGTSFGSFVSFTTPAAGAVYSFVKFGANQPKTIPTNYMYNSAKDTLSMSMFGRGCFVLQQATSVLTAAAGGDTSNTVTNSACTTPLYPNVPNAYGYSSGANPTPIGFGGATTSSSTAGTASSSSTAGATSSSSTAAVASSSSTAAVSSSSAAAAVSSSSSSAGISSSSTVTAVSVTSSSSSAGVVSVSSSSSTPSSTSVRSSSATPSSSSGVFSSTAPVSASSSSTGVSSSGGSSTGISSTGSTISSSTGASSSSGLASSCSTSQSGSSSTAGSMSSTGASSSSASVQGNSTSTISSTSPASPTGGTSSSSSTAPSSGSSSSSSSGSPTAGTNSSSSGTGAAISSSSSVSTQLSSSSSSSSSSASSYTSASSTATSSSTSIASASSSSSGGLSSSTASSALSSTAPSVSSSSSTASSVPSSSSTSSFTSSSSSGSSSISSTSSPTTPPSSALSSSSTSSSFSTSASSSASSLPSSTSVYSSSTTSPSDSSATSSGALSSTVSTSSSSAAADASSSSTSTNDASASSSSTGATSSTISSSTGSTDNSASSSSTDTSTMTALPASSSTGSSDGSGSTASSVGSSSSSTGVSSSSTGSDNSLPFVTTIDIPTDLPLAQFSLTPEAIQGWRGLQSFKANFQARVAYHARVSAERVVILRLDNSGGVTSDVFVQFSISAALSGDAVDAAMGMRYFLSRAWQTPAATAFTTDPIFAYIVSGTVVLSPDQSIPIMPEVKFSLTYDLSSLPGGSASSFRALVLNDISVACAVPQSRLTLVSLLAGSVNALFLITPIPQLTVIANPNAYDPLAVAEVTEPDSNVVANNFVAAASNTSSKLYDGAVTRATVSSSATIGQLSRASTASQSSSGGGFIGSLSKAASIGVVIGIVAGVCILLVLLMCCLRSKDPQIAYESPKQQNSVAAKEDTAKSKTQDPPPAKAEGSWAEMTPVHPAAGKSQDVDRNVVKVDIPDLQQYQQSAVAVHVASDESDHETAAAPSAVAKSPPRIRAAPRGTFNPFANRRAPRAAPAQSHFTALPVSEEPTDQDANNRGVAEVESLIGNGSPMSSSHTPGAPTEALNLTTVNRPNSFRLTFQRTRTTPSKK